ncbi:unnamed protein product [Vicia faba]|uniref:Uncharacterized protein n=1 Tax=Vicia faba TaxID=3906 RepID=A0AAV1AKY3_VICFA|nr:unnamed protein product [Vicia faba]
MNQLGQLRKSPALANDHSLTIDMSVRVSVPPIVSSTFAPEAQMFVVVVSPTIVETNILVKTLEVNQSATTTVNFFAWELSHSLSPTKRDQDPDFFWGLSATDMWSLFRDASHTLFMAGSLVSIVVTWHDDVLGSNNLSRERDEIRERCETLERKNFDAKKELVELRNNPDVITLCKKT